MNIICFHQKYEKEVVDLWNRSMHADQIDIQKFRRQILFDENFDENLCLLAVENGSVAGFIWGIKRKFPYLERGLEPEKGWINVLFVKKEYRRQGIGSRLVCSVEERLKQTGARQLILAAYSPGYFFPGIDMEAYPEAILFFEHLGYSGTGYSYSMYKDLHGFSISPEYARQRDDAVSQGFSFRGFEWGDSLELLKFAGENFGGGWKRNLLISMQNRDAEDVITLALFQNKIAGFAMRKMDGNPMRFGPIGVCEEFRSRGIGSILFELKQWEMCSKGIYHLYFSSTDEPGRRFYERHGVKVFRICRKYEKKL